MDRECSTSVFFRMGRWPIFFCRDAARRESRLALMKEQRIIELLTPAIAALGLECLGIEFAPHAHNSLLRVYIEAPKRAVTVDDCERASREIAAVLDVEDPIESRYTLEVSSPGLDRPLFTAEQVARHVGETAKITLALPQDGRRRVQGRIEAVEGECITLDVDGNPVAVEFGNVAKARLVPDFAGILPGATNKPTIKPGTAKPGTAARKQPPRAVRTESNNRPRSARGPKES